MFPVPYLYHVTPRSNLDSILEVGLRTRHCGDVHGEMDMHPPLPAIYLSRKEISDNLHTELFTRGELVVLKIDASRLEAEYTWPDDFIYDMFAQEEFLQTTAQVATAFGVDKPAAKQLLALLNDAPDELLPGFLKPCWPWYLASRNGGEIAYTADIGPDCIVEHRPYPSRAAKARP